MPSASDVAAHGSPPAVGSDRPRALVTGAGRGIGATVAVRLAHEGHRLALTARSRDELEQVAGALPDGTDVLVLPDDLMDAEAPGRLVRAVTQAWGGIDVLICNAGAGVSAPVVKTSDSDWQRMLDLNLTAPFRLMRAALPGMVDRGWGRVVVVASVAAKVGEPYISAYVASKHGVLGLVRAAAAELARSGVTVNAVCPGYVDTPMTDATVRGIVEMTGRTEAEARRILERKQPTGRLVTTDEVAEAVWACVANSGITGQGINVDGGAVQS
ncbi:MAG TPA: SDR family oxidoreductase [Actinomycetales bacterium]|nr:SDR family oxidoreductase [Actinomycetales bacterium]